MRLPGLKKKEKSTEHPAAGAWFRHHKKPVDPVKAERNAKRAAFLNRFSLLIHLVLSVLGYFVIEAMARHSFAQAWAFVDQRTKVFFYNALLIFVTTLPVYLFRKRAFLRVLIAAIWMGLGTANGIVLANRVTPLTGPDFGMMEEAVNVSKAYFSPVSVIALAVVVVFLLLRLVKYFFTSPVYQGKRRLKIWIPVLLAAAAGMYGLTIWNLNTKQLSSYFSNIASAYLDYGFPYSLGVTIFDTGINQPNHYSEEQMMEILEEEGARAVETTDAKDAPNIVIVQLESFFDTARVKSLRVSEDPLPNWHAFAKTMSNGYYTVPTVGAGTVNTEFETITGMSLRFFGAGEYPYKGILRKQTCESLAYDLGKLGYTAHAIHNNEANFYGRRKVYANLGFNSFTSGEYMNTQDDVNENGWMRDRNLIQPIADALDSTENKDLVFAVSVQPHGSYPTEQTLSNPVITVSGMGSEEKNNQWEYYVNQIYETDQFVADLIAYLESRDEPTVCLFYGDHLPTLGLSNRDLRSGTIMQTNYLLWSSEGLERRLKTISSYQAAAELLSRIDMHVGTMFTYHQTMRGSRDYLYNMQVLQYDVLYGKRYVYGKTNPYQKTILGLGVNPILVNRIQKLSSDGSYYIYGQNFTQSCKFKLNDDLKETTYIDSGTLLVRDLELTKGDWVSVAVESNSSGHGILSTSNTLVYGVGKLSETEPEADEDESAVESQEEQRIDQTVLTTPAPEKPIDQTVLTAPEDEVSEEEDEGWGIEG
ncbi:MAG: LTA synthase family protein [Lachnospiraceae bacterium]|nr:LTA synthase family protein [Lachnospiraceae bacterium]